jgi:BirA family biotin operon repressor/biotin-[acetyl-CoA-carboxylase] ligase
VSRILTFRSLDSTNSEVARQADAGAPDGLWVLAEQQTAGRGRRARAWVSPPGNLYATGLVRPQLGEPPAAQLSFVAGLASHAAIAAFVPDVQLKWPNDLVVDRAGQRLKLSGILLEASGVRTPQVIAVGIGINLAHHPTDVERPATSVAAVTGTAPAPLAVLEAVITAFDHWRALWSAEGFAPVRAAWLERCTGLGERIAVRLGGPDLTGTFQGIDSEGALRLRLDSGDERAIHAGDVFGI